MAQPEGDSWVPSPQNAAGGGTHSKKISWEWEKGWMQSTEEGEREPRRDQGCHSRVTTLPSPQRTTLLSRALPPPQGRRLEPAPSPSELLIGFFFLQRSSSGINPRREERHPRGTGGERRALC